MQFRSNSHPILIQFSPNFHPILAQFSYEFPSNSYPLLIQFSYKFPSNSYPVIIQSLSNYHPIPILLCAPARARLAGVQSAPASLSIQTPLSIPISIPTPPEISPTPVILPRIGRAKSPLIIRTKTQSWHSVMKSGAQSPPTNIPARKFGESFKL